ncbi:MAG: gamma-glutamyltransferase [Sedimenticola thiotaurini]|uniref:Glutathione hydrolase proenzyme n=1 Tax=Sedimenticola thiotaurini TaxID=1543721 RepID=A0A558CZI8_9GAMM|nr:MAG: gamma-glutamyltransferase [Sedimenticola thiotaurini]
MFLRFRLPLFLVLLLLGGLFFTVAAQAAEGKAGIASAHPLATEAGMAILNQGGNAFDAAITVAAVLAVVEPYSSGMGGGGFWMLHRAKDGMEVMLDGRERAPLAAHRDLYLDQQGEVIPGLSVNGPLAAGIPGQPAALAHLALLYGRLSLSQTLAPAIHLAREGFPVDEHYRRMAQWRLAQLQRWPGAQNQFLQQGVVPVAGHLLKQPDLADTLMQMAEQGHDGFYRGGVAERLVNGVREAGGIWTLDDLAQYRIMERKPIRGEYRGMTITSAAPPSSGGIVLLSMLNQLAQFKLEKLPSLEQKHLIIEVMRRAYRDRAEYLGDPDFVSIPVKRLIDTDYAAGLTRSIQLDAATPSRVTPPHDYAEGRDTTHYSIVDAEGNRVSATLSINYPFGSCFVVPGTGILLNDEMDDFSARPGTPNVYGLVGGEANAIAPGKRMLSSMTPTFVETEAGVAVLGTPGGSRIISMLLHGVLALAEGKDPVEWVSRPRYHHQYLPDEVQFEPEALTPQEQQQLNALGHKLKPLDSSYGNMQALFWDKKSGRVSGASDPRGLGKTVVQ